MRNERIRILAEIALAVALASVLNLWQIRLPWNIAGGSITLTMLPIFVVALRRGAGAGMIAGALYGTLDLIFNPYIVHWAQVLLDYPLPYLLVGLSGLGASSYRTLLEKGRSSASAVAGLWMLLGGAGRFVSHLLSGVIFFAEYAPAGQNVWVYSIIYNASYLVPSLVASIVVALVLLPVLHRAVPVSVQQA